MTATPDISEDERGLDALAQIDLRLAQVFAARAEAAEDPEVANGLVRSYQRAARSYRQTLALKHRLRRELKRERREDRTDDRKEHARAVSARKAQVRAAVKVLIWTEAEPPEAERLEDDLEEWLADLVVMDGFAATPVEHHVARLRRDLGLAAEDAVPDPQAPDEAGPPAPPPHPTDPPRAAPDDAPPERDYWNSA